MQITVNNDQYRTSYGSYQQQQATASTPLTNFRYGIDKLHSSVPVTNRSTEPVGLNYREGSNVNTEHRRLPYSGLQKPTVVDYQHEALPTNKQQGFSSLAQVREVAQNTGKILSQLDGWQRISLQPTSVAANSGGVNEDRPHIVNYSNSAYTRLSASNPAAQTIMKNISKLGAAFGGSGVSSITRSNLYETQTKYESSTDNKDMWKDVDDRVKAHTDPHTQLYLPPLGFGGGSHMSDNATREPNRRIPELVEYPKGILKHEPRQQAPVQNQVVCDQIALKFQQSNAARAKTVAPKTSAPACDPIITQVLKSIGFNFELSKISQEQSHTEQPSKPATGSYFEPGSSSVTEPVVGRVNVFPSQLGCQNNNISNTEMMSRRSVAAGRDKGLNVHDSTSKADQLISHSIFVANISSNMGAAGFNVPGGRSSSERVGNQSSKPVVLRYTAKPVIQSENIVNKMQVSDQRFSTDAIADVLSAAKRLYSKHNLGKQAEPQSLSVDRSPAIKRRSRSLERNRPKSVERKQPERRKSRSPYSASKSRRSDAVRDGHADRILSRTSNASSLKGHSVQKRKSPVQVSKATQRRELSPSRGRATLPSKRRISPKKTRSRSRDRRRVSSRSRSRDRRKLSPVASRSRSQVRHKPSSTIAGSISKDERLSVKRRNRSPSPKRLRHRSRSPSKPLKRKRSVSPSRGRRKSEDRERSPTVASSKLMAPVHYPLPAFPMPWATTLPFPPPHVPMPCIPQLRLPPPIMPVRPFSPKPYWQRTASRSAGDVHSDWERSTEEFLKKLQQTNTVTSGENVGGGNVAEAGASERRLNRSSNISRNSVSSESASHLSLSTVSSVELGDYVSVEDSSSDVEVRDAEIAEAAVVCDEEHLSNTQKFQRLVMSASIFVHCIFLLQIYWL